MKTQAGRGIGGRAKALLAAAVTVGMVGAVGATAVVALPAQARAADGDTLPPYAFDPSAQRVRGAATSSDAAPLTGGRTYRDTLRKDGKVYYRVDLDDRRGAYVSVVAVPRPGGKVDYGDGFEVTMQDGSGADCGSQRVNFSSGHYTRPLAAYARRTVNPDSSTCRKAGAYYVLVERATKAGSDPGDWELEIRYLTEPALKEAGPSKLPEAWPSGTPSPPTGGPKVRQGGSGVHDAVSLEQGEWRSDIRPGQTLFYRVPLDWGQQLFAAAELGSSPEDGGYVSNALVLSLDNPALGHVDQGAVGYNGKPATLPLGPQRPVAHENRTSYNETTNGVRFAGWYYLSATLSPEIAKEYGEKAVPLTLRVNVMNRAVAGPGYDGDPGPFAVTAGDREAAASGAAGERAAGAAERGDTMRLVAAAGLGTGTVLLLGLGAWTVVARRRAA